MKSNPLLTIYTPTYNREELLPRVYNSLKQQTCKDFIWQIIDDGSNDNTSSLISKWAKEERDFEIHYYYKENGGIHTARDAAYRICDTELVFSCDSDDWLPDDAVEEILKRWSDCCFQKQCIGIIGKCAYADGVDITKKFPNIEKAFWQDVFFKYKCTGDTAWVYNTKIIQGIPNAPVFAGERLIGEMYKCMQLPTNEPILLLNKVITIKEYQLEGYTARAYEYIFKNPRGFREDYKQSMLYAVYSKQRIKGYLGYIASSILLRDKKYIKNSSRKLQTFLLTPMGWLTLQYLKIRVEKEQKRYNENHNMC